MWTISPVPDSDFLCMAMAGKSDTRNAVLRLSDGHWSKLCSAFNVVVCINGRAVMPRRAMMLQGVRANCIVDAVTGDVVSPDLSDLLVDSSGALLGMVKGRLQMVGDVRRRVLEPSMQHLEVRDFMFGIALMSDGQVLRFDQGPESTSSRPDARCAVQ